MKEEKLFYDPRSSLLLELVEEYIEHNLIAEAETLLKDYLRTNPMSEKAISLWIKIATLQKDEEKEKYLRQKLREIKEKKGETVKFEEIVERKEEAVEKKEELEKKEGKREEHREILEFLKGIDELEEVKDDEELLSFLTVVSTYLKKWGFGEPEQIIIESEKPEVGFRMNGRWNFLVFRENTNFVTLRWTLKKLKWKE